MPSTRPRITFDGNGLCNGCQIWDHRAQTDWSLRRDELQNLLNEAKIEASRRGTGHHCVLAWSGGKDSSAIALHLKEEFGVNPLLVTFNQLIPTAEGISNRKNLIDYGFDALLVEPNRDISRRLSRHFFETRGDPKLHWNAGVHASPIRLALGMRIPLVFFAENGEAEYGGRLLSPKHLRNRDYEEMVSNAVGADPLDWNVPGVSETNLAPYQYPLSQAADFPLPETLYFAYFFPWDGASNLQYLSNYISFQESSRGRNYGAFSGVNGVDDVMEDLYYYMQYIKFGFGRAWKDASRMIQRGRLTAEEAIELVTNTDGEFPEDSIPPAADYMKMNIAEVKQVIDRHRSKSIWADSGNNQWLPRFDYRYAFSSTFGN